MARARIRTWVTGVLILAACVGETPPRAADTAAIPTAVHVIDSTISPAVAGAAGWNYQQRASADLDGDGVAEQVVLTARVELYRGRPAWDDGQPWQVYVEAADSARTYIYAQFVQLGTLTMRIGKPAEGAAASIVLIEHLPDRVAVYEARYDGPGRASVSERFARALDPRGELAGPRLP